jgi:hypothetical protein
MAAGCPCAANLASAAHRRNYGLLCRRMIDQSLGCIYGVITQIDRCLRKKGDPLWRTINMSK